MDPETGKVYSPEEIPSLPKDIRDRLVPVPREKSRPVKRKPQKGKTYDIPSKAKVDKRRAANKAARKSRKKNR